MASLKAMSCYQSSIFHPLLYAMLLGESCRDFARLPGRGVRGYVSFAWDSIYASPYDYPRVADHHFAVAGDISRRGVLD